MDYPLDVEPKGKELEFTEKGAKFLELCAGLKIVNDVGLIAADELAVKGAKEVKLIKEFINPHIDRAFVAHRELTKSRSAMITPIEAGKKILQGKMLEYSNEQERKAKVEEAKRVEAARKKEAAARKIADNKKLSEAQALEDRGRPEEAQQVMDAPAENTPVHVAPFYSYAKPKTKTIFVDRWVARVVDKAKVPEHFKTVNQGMLDRFAKDTKGAVPIEGCVIVKTDTAKTNTK